MIWLIPALTLLIIPAGVALRGCLARTPCPAPRVTVVELRPRPGPLAPFPADETRLLLSTQIAAAGDDLVRFARTYKAGAA